MRRLIALVAVLAAVTLAACTVDSRTNSVRRIDKTGPTDVSASEEARPSTSTAQMEAPAPPASGAERPDPTTTTTVPPPFFSEQFAQPDGPLGNGWTNPTPAPTMQVVDGKGSSDGAEGYRVAFKQHGVDVSGDWQIDVDVDGPTDDDEGVSVLLVDSTFTGVGFFAGNAVHVQEFLGGSEHVNHANQARPGGGSPGHLTQHVRMTFRKATGEYVVYLDGERWASASAPNEDFASTAGDTVVILAGSLHSPTYEATLDNLTVKAFVE